MEQIRKQSAAKQIKVLLRGYYQGVNSIGFAFLPYSSKLIIEWSHSLPVTLDFCN